MSKKQAAVSYLSKIKLQQNLDVVLNSLVEKEPSDPFTFLAREFSKIAATQSISTEKSEGDKVSSVSIRTRVKQLEGDVEERASIFQEAGDLKEEEAKDLGLTGIDLLRNPALNQGLAFSHAQRLKSGIHGLLPPVVANLDREIERVMWNVKQFHCPLEKYKFFLRIAESNSRLFYATLIKHITELMPIVYTPTVGKACIEFGHIYDHPAGMYITIHDLGNVETILRNWPAKKVQAIVMTDGQRILGLGDLGASGMGIPIGKLALYTACAGINPEYCLPVVLDVGTNNELFLEDPLYLGIREKRHTGEAYDALVKEFLDAATKVFGEHCILQFEDFANANAFRLLAEHRDNYLTFNDDIQGTAAVTLAGVLSSCIASETKLKDHTFLFYGAGSAGLGIANLIVSAIVDESGGNVSVEEARKQVWLVDSRGLIYKDRASGGIKDGKVDFAHEFDRKDLKDLGDIVAAVGATALIGVSAQSMVFTERVCGLMGRNVARPIIFPLSNPTSKAEGNPTVAYNATEGKCIFASGSPFDPVTVNGKTLVPGQGNNAFIFPGLSLGIIAAEATRVPENLFMVAAKSLASHTSEENRAKGCMYPSIKEIREVSVKIAVDVAAACFDNGLTTKEKPADLTALVNATMWSPFDN